MEAESDLVAKLEKDRRHSRRVIFWFIMAAIALPVVAVVCAYLYDCAPPEDGDMRPHWTTVPLAENGLGQFQEWLEKHPVKELPKNPETELGKPTWKVEAALKLVADYQDALDEFDKLAKTDITKWRWKEGAAMAHYTALLPYDAQMQSLMRLTQHRAKILLMENNAEEAMAQGMKLMRIGRGMQNEGVLIHLLVGMTVQSAGEKIAADAIARFPSYPPEAGAWKKLMVECEPKTDALMFALKTEYEAIRNLMIGLKAKKTSASSVYPPFGGNLEGLAYTIGLRPNRTLRLYLDLQRPLVRAVEKDWSAVSLACDLQINRIKEMRHDLWSLTSMVLRGNPGGEMLINMSLPAIQKIADRHYTAIALHRITFTQFAIREYELASHKLPAMLSDLVPGHLDAVPLDPFDRKPLRWDVATKLIYSIGADMVDNGGDIDEKKPAKGKDVGQKYWWANAADKS